MATRPATAPVQMPITVGLPRRTHSTTIQVKPAAAVANWVTFTPDSRTIYVSNAALRSVTAIDTRAMKVIAVIPVGEVPKRINTMVIPAKTAAR